MIRIALLAAVTLSLVGSSGDAQDAAALHRERRRIDDAEAQLQPARLALPEPELQYGAVTAWFDDRGLALVTALFCGDESCSIERLYFRRGALVAAVTGRGRRDAATRQPELADEYLFRQGRLLGWSPQDGLPRTGPYPAPVVDDANRLVADARRYRAMAEAQRRAQSRDWHLELRGSGPVRFGMTLEEASRAADHEVHDEARDWSCADWTPLAAEGIAGVPVFAIRNHVVAYAALVTPEGRTRRGARVGMSEESVKRLYPDGLEVVASPRDRPGDHWLIYTPNSPADAAYRMAFATEDARVTAIYAGRWPFEQVLEGCSP